MDFLKKLKEIEGQDSEKLMNELEKNIWTIKSHRELDEVLAQYNVLMEEKDEVNKYAKRALRDYKAKVEKFLNEEESRIDYLAGKLEGLMEQYYNSLGETKRLKLINGSVGYRKQRDKLEYDTENLDKIISKIESIDPELIRHKKELNKREINKVYDVIGDKVVIKDEVVPGVEFIEGEQIFNIRTEGGK